MNRFILLAILSTSYALASDRGTGVGQSHGGGPSSNVSLSTQSGGAPLSAFANGGDFNGIASGSGEWSSTMLNAVGSNISRLQTQIDQMYAISIDVCGSVDVCGTASKVSDKLVAAKALLERAAEGIHCGPEGIHCKTAEGVDSRSAENGGKFNAHKNDPANPIGVQKQLYDEPNGSGIRIGGGSSLPSENSGERLSDRTWKIIDKKDISPQAKGESWGIIDKKDAAAQGKGVDISKLASTGKDISTAEQLLASAMNDLMASQEVSAAFDTGGMSGIAGAAGIARMEVYSSVQLPEMVVSAGKLVRAFVFVR